MAMKVALHVYEDYMKSDEWINVIFVLQKDKDERVKILS